MWQRLFSFFKKTGWPLLVALLMYGVLGVVRPFSSQHVLYNLEPYPDGLFYVDAAHNFAVKGAFEVRYRDDVIKPRIEPLYPVVLAIGYILNSSPAAFYATNFFLGAVSIIFLFFLLRNLTHKNLWVALGLFLYILHLHVIWLISLPMAENLGLTIFLAVLYGMTLPRLNLRSVGLLSLGIGLLVLTKYTFIGPAGVLTLYLFYRVWREFPSARAQKWRALLISLITFFILATIFFLYQVSIGYNPFASFTATQFGKASTVSGITFYSLSFIIPNLSAYLKVFTGQESPFLWLSYPFTQAGFWLLLMGGSMWVWIKEKKLGNSALFLLLFLSQFPLLLIFYVVDDRYVIFSVPLIAASIIAFLEKCSPAYAKYFVLLILGVCVVQGVGQRNFLKTIIADNLFQRSTAWQYEAVQHIDQNVPADAYVITALPPLFVDLYSHSRYRVLPLSLKQEFADKHQYIWGSDVQYDDLSHTYEQLLAEHKPLFVTNAYLSSNHDMAIDWTKIQDHFTLQKVSDGCLGTCDIFVVQSKVH